MTRTDLHRMKILSVVGARPNFMKIAPIVKAIRQHNAAAISCAASHSDGTSPSIDHILVHTGQHYDTLMSDSFFSDLNLPVPDVQLGVGSGSQAVQTAEILKRFEEVVLRERPDVVVVVGDVNSTLACALVTAKIAFDALGSRPLLAHVEAGLRSFDRTMPEEVNRVVTDHVSDLLFVSEPSGLRNLSDEGISEESVHFVGNTMIDSLLAFEDLADKSTVLEVLNLRSNLGSGPDGILPYGLLTLHRPANVDDPEAFGRILAGLGELSRQCPIVFPAHPRTQRRIAEHGLKTCGTNGCRKRDGSRNGLVMIEPLGYLDFLSLMKHAAVVVTDSGGIQEETTCLGVPCVTVRENTERPVTVTNGTNVIAGTTADKIKDAIERQMRRPRVRCTPEQWDGRAAERIVEILIRAVSARKSGSVLEHSVHA